MKRLSIIFLFMILMFVSSAFAQNIYHWDFAGWYGGGCFPNVEFDPNVKDRVYLTSDVTGIWRSDDLGEHWRFINKGLGHLIVSQVAVAPSDSNVLYAATGGGVFYSLNAGELWNKADNANKQISFQRPANYRSIAVDAHNPAQLCVGSAKGQVFCSNNYGSTWKEIPHFGPEEKKPIPVLYLTSDGRALIVGFPKVLARFDFKTSAWESLGTFKNITDVAIDFAAKTMYVVASEDRVWIKREGDKDWDMSTVLPKGIAYRIALGKGRIYAAWLKNWDGGVVGSEDQGQTWQNFNQNLKADIVRDPTRSWAQKDTKITSLKISPFDSKIMFRSDFWGVWRSDDGGLSWNEKIQDAPNSVGGDIAVNAKDEIFVATMDNGLLKSSDGGQTYAPLFPKDKYRDDENGHIWRVALSGDQTIIATSSPWGKIINQVVISSNAGGSFQKVQEGLPLRRPKVNTVWGEGYARALAIDPKDPNTVYLGIDGDDGGGLFVSSDGGLHWQRSAGQPGALRIFHGLTVDPLHTNVLVWGATGKNGGVYISEDKGQTFRYAFKQMQWVFNVVIGADGKIYAGGDSSSHPTLFVADSFQKPFHLLKTFAGGLGKAIDAIAINPKDPKMIAVSTVSWGNGSPCKFFMTRDAGKTWEEINGDLPDGAGAPAMTFDPQGQTLYMSRYAGGVYKLRV